jgi:predicted dehydrogenase
MKFLIIGLGSMGKRRIRNLKYLNAGEIFAFDVKEERRKEAEEKYGIKTFGDFDDAMSINPDALIISVPPDLHAQYTIAAAKAGKHFFCEADVVTDGMEELIELCQKANIVAAPSCTMRFHPLIRTIKKLVDDGVIGKILCLTYHCGQYLPDWHPWEDYRTFYVARRRTGAGREMVPFELDWISWVVGKIDVVSCLKGKLTNLDIDIDDAYQLLLKFNSGTIGSLLIDVISRVPYRMLKLISESGIISWDWSNKYIEVFDAESKEWRKYHQEEETITEKGYVAAENMYIHEMDHFVKAVKGEVKYMNSFEDDYKLMKTLLAAEESSDKGIHIVLGN